MRSSATPAIATAVAMTAALVTAPPEPLSISAALRTETAAVQLVAQKVSAALNVSGPAQPTVAPATASVTTSSAGDATTAPPPNPFLDQFLPIIALLSVAFIVLWPITVPLAIVYFLSTVLNQPSAAASAAPVDSPISPNTSRRVVAAVVASSAAKASRTDNGKPSDAMTPPSDGSKDAQPAVSSGARGRTGPRVAIRVAHDRSGVPAAATVEVSAVAGAELAGMPRRTSQSTKTLRVSPHRNRAVRHEEAHRR